ncbi:flagellar biosynthetic protein FliR [Bordetella petrii]|uniref:flagellar biosynthetic protein FliR n=1 Tax=Bordetella petrii TaxID=94624 RepID=UPI001E532CF0|nr:flagellar biosynthetic protein FliR [Bordetella petrii]MCD0506130.1 flagellar biosynthetic protein FliR [Bordetella petrii]
MFEFTQQQLDAWLLQFVWPFARILALVGSAPLFSESTIPTRVKVGLAFMLTAAVAPGLPPPPAIPPSSFAALLLLAQQVLIGVAMGFAMRVVFAAVQTAGEFVGLQMGLSFASFFDPATGANTAVLSRLFNIVAMLVFLALDGHLLVLAALVRSFDTLPLAEMGLDRNGWGLLAQWGETIFVSGLLLALPLICALLIINLAMGILNRAAPQLSVFAVGFPVSLIAGMVLLMVVLPQSAPFLEGLFRDGLRVMSEVAAGLAGI